MKGVLADVVSCCVYEIDKRLCSTFVPTIHTCLTVGPIGTVVYTLLVKSSMVHLHNANYEIYASKFSCIVSTFEVCVFKYRVIKN